MVVMVNTIFPSSPSVSMITQYVCKLSINNVVNLVYCPETGEWTLAETYRLVL